jgi:aryl-alcohol dehydrogenase-like predicted oxidoreductase
MEQRPLGRTGCEVSIVGFGGIVVTDLTQEEADRLVAEAFDRGVTYFDVAPSYGNAEERLGPALAPYRDRAFLACKTMKRTREEADLELRESLRRLRTDHLDLYQIHALSTREELETALSAGGAIEAFTEAQEAGRIRFIGFSAHSQEVALEAMDRFQFASVLFPVNFTQWFRAFGPPVVEKAMRKGIGRLALKAMARQRWPEGEAGKVARAGWPKCWYEPAADPVEAAMALRFTLSQPISAAIPPGDARLFRLALETAERFTPITAAEEEELRERASGYRPFFEIAA